MKKKPEEDEVLAEIERQVCRADPPRCTGVKPDVVCKAQQPKTICSRQDNGLAHLEREHYTEPQLIACKWCGSTDTMKYGIVKGEQVYICRKCHRKFRANDKPYRKQSTVEEIGAALNMFYDGMSLSAIGRHLGETHSHPVNGSTVYRWILRYTSEATSLLSSLRPRVSGVWIADETVLRIGGDKLWFWDIIDNRTRFLLASHISRTRTTQDARRLMYKAANKAAKSPRTVITDKLAAYLDGIELTFGADTKHVQSSPFAVENSTALIERFHGSLKQRTKVLRGFKTVDTAALISDGFLIYYNYFRPHMSLGGRTPAEVAGIKAPVKTWTDVVREGALDGNAT